MTDKKWTPGPWVVDEDNGDYPLFISGHADEVIYGCGCCGSPNMTMVDARLIAAAPDLYDALEVLLSHVETSEDVGNEVWIETHHKHVDAAVKALAKARGET